MHVIEESEFQGFAITSDIYISYIEVVINSHIEYRGVVMHLQLDTHLIEKYPIAFNNTFNIL